MSFFDTFLNLNKPQLPEQLINNQSGGKLANFFGMGGPPGGQFMAPNGGDLSSYGANPYAKGLSSYIAGMTPVSAQNITAPNMSPYYDAMKSRLDSQYSQQQGRAQDAIDRQFAAMGGGPGNGAQLKQTELLEQNTENQKGQDLQALNAQQLEQQGEYGFQAQQANAANQLAAQEFNQQQQLGAQSSLANLNSSWDQAQAEAKNNEFNKIMAQFQATHSGGLLGGGGFLGLGFGAGGGLPSWGT